MKRHKKRGVVGQLNKQVLRHPQEPLSLLNAMVVDGGSLSVQAALPFGSTGVVTLNKQPRVLLHQGEKESMFAFLCRLEHTLAAAIITGEVIDEIGHPSI